MRDWRSASWPVRLADGSVGWQDTDSSALSSETHMHFSRFFWSLLACRIGVGKAGVKGSVLPHSGPGRNPYPRLRCHLGPMMLEVRPGGVDSICPHG